MMLTDLADVIRAGGMKVVETEGWKKRGHSQMSGVRSIICHHTAGPKTGNIPSLNVLINGHSTLAGPLCQLGLARDGTVYVIAAGIGFHAGVVNNPSVQGNPYAIGIEAEATGVDNWPVVQYDAYVRLVRILCDYYGLGTDKVYGHKEACKPKGRKSDPNFDMVAFRGNVDNRKGVEMSAADIKLITDKLDLIIRNQGFVRDQTAEWVGANPNSDPYDKVSDHSHLFDVLTWIRNQVAEYLGANPNSNPEDGLDDRSKLLNDILSAVDRVKPPVPVDGPPE